MIQGEIAIWLNMMTIAIISFLLATLVVSTAFVFLQHKLFNIAPKNRRLMLWLIVLAPWVAALCVACDFSVVMLNDRKSIESFITHWHHITRFDLFTWHGVLLITWPIIALYLIAIKLTTLIKHQRQIRSIEQFSLLKSHNVYQLNSDCVSAFTSGLIKPKCYVSTGMFEHTTDIEQDIILKHEQAHAKNKDPLKKWLFSLFASFFPNVLSTKLKMHLSLTMEQMADEAVAKTTTSSTDIASTLIKVARMNQNFSPDLEAECITNFGASTLEQRVLFLLGQLENKPVSKSISLTLLAITTACCLLSIDSIHHLIELLFQH
ncbi:MAG: M48 family metalloprotease [Shewanella sp.]|nr:M48 family metalloprotease [Shewanella sp.]